MDRHSQSLLMPGPGLSAEATSNASNIVPILAASTAQEWRPLLKEKLKGATGAQRRGSLLSLQP